MSDAVIVVDMQRCFVEEGSSLDSGPEVRRIIPHIKALLEKETRRGSKILFTADTHDEDDLEFQMFPRHCVVGLSETQIIPDLQPWVKPENVIRKRRYSAFFETDLAERLAGLKPDVIRVCGVCTDICVLHTVADLRNRDYKVVVEEDCVATFDPEAHQFALRHMDKILGAEIHHIDAGIDKLQEETR
jgi:nicotinamidase/pyrazinamidase